MDASMSGEDAELVERIRQIKRRKGDELVILGHHYQRREIVELSDYRGDSLQLSRNAAERKDARYIVFCGVKFMAETAKILSPHKTVLLPAEKAGCSLAESITAQDVRELKERFPGVPVVTYVNTYAEVKAETDICCTSGNAVRVVQSLESDKVIFLPDEYLAMNVALETGKKIIFPKKGQAVDKDYDIIGWQGRCEVHEKFSEQDVINVKKQFPDTIVLAHPECSPEVTQAADFSGSTSAMIKYVEESNAPHYLLLTECAMGDNIAAAHPEKEMLRLCSVRCPHMNQITLEDTLLALQKNRYVIEVPEDIRLRAQKSVQRMIEIV